jgi:hypothetical protein
VLIQQVKVIGLQSLERAFDGLTEILRPARCFGADLLSVLEPKAKFGGDDRLAEQLLVVKFVAEGRIFFDRGHRRFEIIPTTCGSAQVV